MDKFIRFNTAIIPTREVSEIAIGLSRKLAKKWKAGFVLDGKNFNPHITCYSPEYPSKNIDKIESELEKISQGYKKFEIYLEGLHAERGRDYVGIGISVKKSKEIDDLHKDIIKVLNPLREGYLREKYKDPEYVNLFPDYKKEAMTEAMLKVGYPRVLDAYEPHISITALFLKDEDEEVKLPEFEPRRMQVSELGLFTMGEFGTCRELLQEFILS